MLQVDSEGMRFTEYFYIECACIVACAGAGGGAGGVVFEVWCRYYYPNVRDQVIAKV